MERMHEKVSKERLEWYVIGLKTRYPARVTHGEDSTCIGGLEKFANVHCRQERLSSPRQFKSTITVEEVTI